MSTTSQIGGNNPPAGPIASGSSTVRTADNSGIESWLDKYDQDKMSHALDKPLGKATEWSNPRTGVNFTVTPIAKLTYNGNPYCRKYTIVSSRQGMQQQSTGTACVSATDSSWQIIR